MPEEAYFTVRVVTGQSACKQDGSLVDLASIETQDQEALYYKPTIGEGRFISCPTTLCMVQFPFNSYTDYCQYLSLLQIASLHAFLN